MRCVRRVRDRLWCANLNMIAARRLTLQHNDTHFSNAAIAQGTTHKQTVKIVLLSSLMHDTAALKCIVNGRAALQRSAAN